MDAQTLKFKLTFKRGTKTIAIIEGFERSIDGLVVGDVSTKIIETEQYLERLLGLRVHIETGD